MTEQDLRELLLYIRKRTVNLRCLSLGMQLNPEADKLVHKFEPIEVTVGIIASQLLRMMEGKR